MADCGSNIGSHVNRIPGVRLDDAGFIHTPYGSYNPVTGEGLPIDASKELTRQIQIAPIDDGLDRGLAEDFDVDEFRKEMSVRHQGDP